MKSGKKWLLAVIVVFLVALACALLLPPSKPLPVALPNPNGYDELVAALPQVVPNSGFWRTQELADLRPLLDSNSNALAQVRAALHHEWRVPFTNDPGFTWVMPILSSGKGVAQLFCAEGRRAELEGRTNDALRAYGQCMELGSRISRGGLMIHELVALAIKATGVRDAQPLLATADAAAVRELLDQLIAIDRSMEPAEEIIARDKSWSSVTYGRMRVWWANVVTWKTMRDVRERFRLRRDRSQAELRLLALDAALRLYRERHGKHPDALSALVPEFFSSVPLDPFTGRPFIYKPLTNSYLLYSVGPDGVDDGGKPLTKQITLQRRGLDVEQGDLISTPAAAP